MRLRIILVLFGSFLILSLVSCKEQPSETKQLQNTDQGFVMDKNGTLKINDVPLMKSPGSEIEANKVQNMLREGNLSFRELTDVKATESDLKNNVNNLKQLLDNERVSKDKELQFIVHTMLGNSYLRLYKDSEKRSYINQAEEHFDTAIAMFANEKKYKSDLAEAYLARMGVYAAKKEHDKAESEMKYLIKEYQDIGYGPYKNWFTSYQVEGLHNLARMDSSKSGRSQEIMSYLKDLAESYDNEVGITAQISLARHYLNKGNAGRVKALSTSIENRLGTLNNPAFKKDKWEPFKTYMDRIKNKKTSKPFY